MKEKHMDIQLRQTEIEKAIKLYVAAQGINLTGKAIAIQFSATRDKEKGIIANLVIEDSNEVQIPGYTDRNADPVVTTDAPKATLTSINGGMAEAKVATQALPNTIGAAIADAPAAPAATEVAAATEVVEEVVEAPAKADSGLFNDD